MLEKLGVDRAERIRSRQQALLPLAGALLLAWCALDGAIYRSGFYFSLAEPESNTGAVVNSLMLLERQYRPGVRTVLVFGDSRVAEGFSGSIARGEGDIDFINLAVPGSTPRTWYYLLREIVARGYRFDAIVIGTRFQPLGGARLADWPLSPNQDAPLLGLRDLRDYPRSFEAAAMRERGLHAVLFPGLTLRQDTRELLTAPLQRWRSVKEMRPLFLGAVPLYPGREERMPALVFADDARVRDWAGATAAQRALVEGHLAELAAPLDTAVVAANEAYASTWFGALARLATAREAAAIVFALPRGPYPAALAQQDRRRSPPWALPPRQGRPGLADGRAVALPPELLQDLEDPAYFFDAMHCNRAGRERLSALVGDAVRARLDRGS